VSIGVMQAPAGTSTTVYRATVPSNIRSTQVNGSYQQFSIPANHLEMPAAFRNRWIRTGGSGGLSNRGIHCRSGTRQEFRFPRL